jgi:5-methylcytosine-specific restriction endonuclease McrA
MSKRARKRLTAGEKLALSMLQHGRCAICGFPLDPRQMHGDHIIHFARGGADDIGNKRLTCASCNLNRGNKL